MSLQIDVTAASWNMYFFLKEGKDLQGTEKFNTLVDLFINVYQLKNAIFSNS